jgi:hypothetical protein
MDKDWILKEDGSFVIKNYNHKQPFSNFLPAIAGVWGIPLWVFYVNRTQGIISFGIKDKNHSVAEFFPASKAYNFVSLLGFRTFLKINKKEYYEPFQITSPYKKKEEMIIRSASLEIRENNPSIGLSFSVRYFTIPNSIVGGLARVVSIKNTSSSKIHLEILDGLPRVIPFGSRNLFLKDLARTLEAWMHSFIFNRYAIFKLVVDPRDVSHTKYIEGANFNCSLYKEKKEIFYPTLIVDPDIIFGEDKSYSVPINFINQNFKIPNFQITCSKTPCSFSYFQWILKPGEERVFYNIFGSSFKIETIKEFVNSLNIELLEKKEKENERIIEEVKNNALCVSNIKELNHYIKSSYLDNILRGGYPYFPTSLLGKDKKLDGRYVYYIFSRKHGDLERDYNRFKILPSYFSEGEANYRDVNQNRRMDLFFNPFIGKKNIIYFLNFIKIDGYNPLVIKGEKLYFKRKEALYILDKFGIKEKQEKLIAFMEKGFYLGEFFKFIEDEGISVDRKEEIVGVLLRFSTREPQADFGEGYWIDHWHYNLDLIESYLYFFPDKWKDLLLSEDFLFWDDEVRVKERKYRYYLKDNCLYQGESIEKIDAKREIIEKRKRFRNFLRTKKGTIYRTNLIEKLLVIILNKVATLDPEGIGVEMEAAKPGWCDSLNGLPALFGSSLCETLELKRACLFLINNLGKLRDKGVLNIYISEEVFLFLNKLKNLLEIYFSYKGRDRDYFWWDEANSLKERFRKVTFFFIKGKRKKIDIEILVNFLKKLVEKLNIGIKKAKDKKSNIYFTYFTYKVAEYKTKKDCVFPVKFIRHSLPLFLEVPVHILRVEKDRKLYYSLKRSSLFDKKLKMYRLNESLKNEPFEIGRSRVFIPGWLENESIWLHMEYKYLLEVLKCGLYEEFFQDFYKAGVCFFNPGGYGRSILENSSFIVSSAHPDKKLWGKGFVARLTGATAELLNIWIILCLGKAPFFVDKDDKLFIKFSPILKKEFFTKDREKIDFKEKRVLLDKNTFAFKLFSSILVVYHNLSNKDTFRNLKVKTIIIETNGEKHIINSDIVGPPLSYQIREAKVDRIDVFFE